MKVQQSELDRCRKWFEEEAERNRPVFSSMPRRPNADEQAGDWGSVDANDD